MKANNGNLKIAIQKKGRLTQDTLELLKKMGLDFDPPKEKNRLFVNCRNFKLDILFIRDDDIPEYVEEGICDLGIVGANIVEEEKAKVETVENLGFGVCKLCLAVPKKGKIKKIADLKNKKIATSYPNILKKYLKSKNIKAKIVTLNGAVEITPALDVSQAVFDLVSTGSTLRSNGLEIIETVFESEALLIKSPKIKSPAKKELVEKLMMRIQGILKAKNNKYVMMNAPKDALPKIKQIIPGLKSPTVLPLAEEGMIAIHSVVPENVFWEVMEKLKKAGASGILVVNIEKMIA